MSDEAFGAVLATARLRVVPATQTMISAELDGRARLGSLLDAEVPADWPPEHHDRETLMFWHEQLSQRGAAGWWLHYVLLANSARPTLVGTSGFKGSPVDGVVEIGYSVVPSWQRRGLAPEASRALIKAVWERGAEVVVAHTFEHLEPSIAVLRKLGFERAGSSEPDVLEFRLCRLGSR
jgi:RimJ/RimL family protein N-acetyltransferase